MVEVEVRAVYRILDEFVSGAEFAITSHSLKILGGFVAEQLEKHPEDPERIAKNVLRARDRALRQSHSEGEVMLPDGRPMRLLREIDAKTIIGGCDNFPKF